ncbi:MAG: site-2 protease family protein [Bacillota bacterium]
MSADLASTIFALAVLIVSIVIHEVAHGYAANALGDPTARLAGRLTLNPLKHIDPVGSVLIPGLLVLSHTNIMFGWAKPVPYNPYNLKNQRWGEAIVGVAGVATNLLIAVVFALVTRYAVGAGMPAFASAAATISFVNLFLGLFNLLPIPPIDGYTVLRGVLPYRYSLALRRFEDRIAQGGLLTLVLILFLFSQFFAGPFSYFVEWVFRLLIGQ